MREEAQEGAQPKRLLSLRQTRTCKLSDDVLAVKITPDGRLLALALLDSTVQVWCHSRLSSLMAKSLQCNALRLPFEVRILLLKYALESECTSKTVNERTSKSCNRVRIAVTPLTMRQSWKTAA